MVESRCPPLTERGVCHGEKWVFPVVFATLSAWGVIACEGSIASNTGDCPPGTIIDGDVCISADHASTDASYQDQTTDCLGPELDASDARTPTSGDAHADGASATGGNVLAGSFLAVCKTSLAPNAQTSLRFWADVDYAPLASGDRPLAVTLTPLRAKTTHFLAADKVGLPIAMPDCAVDASGACRATHLENFEIPAVANPIAPAAMSGDSLALGYQVGGARSFCASIDFRLRAPFSDTPTGSCLFVALGEGDAIPTLTDAEIACP